MDIYVLSLPDDSARRARLDKSFAPYHLTYQWIEGVDARQWDEATINSQLDHAALWRNMSYHPIPGSIGCYQSHLLAYQALLRSDKQACIILEDDAEVTADFATHIDCLNEASQIFDIIFLCDRRPNRPAPEIGTSAKGLCFTFKRFANIGANGYVINRQAAQMMLARYGQFGIEIDTLLNRWWQTGLRVATTSPELVTHKDMGSSIGYDHIQHVKNPLRRLVNALANLNNSLIKRRRFKRHLAAMRAAYQTLIVT